MIMENIDSESFFTVTPMTERMEDLVPGGVYTGSVKVVNPMNATSDFYYKVRIAPYGVIGQDYEADFVTDTDWTKMAEWITVDEPTGIIKPNEFKEITYSIKVPENVPAGGQYAAIVIGQDVEPTNDGNSNSVAVKDVFEIASIVYANVKGETIHQGEILENNIPVFVTNAPITLGVMLDNHGNVHEDAVVMIGVKDMFTGDVLLQAENAENYYTELVMPNTTRYVQRDIYDNLPALGVVQVEQTVYYNGNISKEVKDVVICPIWFIVLVVVALMMMVAAIVKIVKVNRKKRKRKDMKISPPSEHSK